MYLFASISFMYDCSHPLFYSVNLSIRVVKNIIVIKGETNLSDRADALTSMQVHAYYWQVIELAIQNESRLYCRNFKDAFQAMQKA